jgi:hypothetical protein
MKRFLASAAFTLCVVISFGAHASSVIYSTFGPNNTYINSIYEINGGSSGITYPDAMPFQSATGAAVSQIDIALGYLSGTNGADVQLWTNSGNALGQLLGSWSLANLPALGNSDLVTISGITGIDLAAGGSYYLWVGQADTSTVLGWYENNQGLSGFFLAGGGTATNPYYLPDDGTFGAFDVIGSVPTTPLPASLPLFASGLGALGLFSWRRHKRSGLSSRIHINPPRGNLVPVCPPNQSSETSASAH